MRKQYLLILILFVGFSAIAQSNLVVIDRDNITTGSTTTGNAAGVSSVGFTRGSGIGRANGGNHTSNSWNGTDAASAEAAGEYIQWSITALPTYTITISDLDIRVRRNNNGPQAWQIFYSFDGFATAGIPFTNEEVNPASATNFFFDSGNTPSLPLINPTEGGTITFRLYAWNSNTNGGWFRIANGAGSGWADLGIASPGARIVGTAVSSSTNSTDSDIVANGGETDNIDYLSFDTASGLTTSNAVQIGSFTIRDGGDLSPDTDSDPTILSDITFTVTNSSFIAALAIFDGTVSMGEVTSVTDLTEFLNLNGGAGISAPDDGTKSFDVYATFTSTVTDNEQIQLTVNSALTPASGSSLFAVGDAGAAQTSIAGDANKIEVVATDLVYLQNTSNTNVFEPMSPAPTLVALDPNINLDLDYSDDVQVFATGTTFDNGATTTVAASGGVIEFSNLSFASDATGAFVTAFAPGFLNSPSNTFDIGPPLITLASQDFDGSQPEWTYTNSVAFFNDDDPNNWGVNGYYGLIDASLASPLNYPTFSNNIVGENRLNSPPDGTDAFARINFGTVNVTGQVGVRISFDWQVSGYQQNRNDVRYNVIINGVAQGAVTLFDGNGAPTEGSGTEIIDIPDGSTSVSLWIENRNRLLTGFCGFDNFRVMAETNVLVYKDGNWYPNAPGELGTEDVLISGGTYTVASPIDVNEITINPLATMEVAPGQHVQTQGLLRNNGSLNLNSTSLLFSSIIPNSVENNGSINYSRFVNVAGTTGINGGNDLISLPLMTDPQTFDEFITFGNPANSTILATNGVFYAFAPFNRSTNAYENFTVAGTDALTRGLGYRVATTSGENLTFSGEIELADVTGIPVTKPTGGSQWNLIGNPYPSYVSSADFITANASVMDPEATAIYGYNSGTGPSAGSSSFGNFTVVNAVTSTVNVAPGQGFFIAVENTDGFSSTVDFTASMRTVVGDNDFILTRTSNQENLNVKLKLSNSNGSRLTDIYFHPNGTRGLDPGYDAATFGNALDGFELYTNLVEDTSGRAMMLQTLGMEDLTDVRIPLGVNASQGQQIRFAVDYSNIPADIEVILEDTETNTFTRLGASDYVLSTTSALSGTGRFYLNFGSNSLSTSEKDLLNLRVYGDYNKLIHIEGQLEFNTKALVYDLQGRLVIQQELAMNETQQTIDASQLNSGIYLVKLDNNTSEHTVKIILK